MGTSRKCENCATLREALAHERARAAKLEERIDLFLGVRRPDGSGAPARSWAADPEVHGGRATIEVNGQQLPLVERDGKPGFMVGSTWVAAEHAPKVAEMFEQYMNGSELPETDLLATGEGEPH